MSILETTYKNLEDDFDSYKDLLRQSEFDLKVLYGKQEDYEKIMREILSVMKILRPDLHS